MHAFSGRFSRTCLEGISFNFFVCFIFNVSLGSAPKRKNFDIQRNTRVASGGQFTLNYHTPSHICPIRAYNGTHIVSSFAPIVVEDSSWRIIALYSSQRIQPYNPTTIGVQHTCKKRVMLRRWLFWPKKFAEKVRKSRQNVNRDKSA